MDPLLWSAILLVMGLILVMLEVFVPSGGVLGFLSVAMILSSIVMAFYNRGIEIGMLFLVAAVVAVPAVLVTAFRYWPQTPMGKRLLLSVPREAEVLPDTPQLRALRQLVGKVGVAKSMMLPSGAVAVDGVTVDAVSEGMAIEPGQRVRVVEVRGNRVVVTPTTDEPRAPKNLENVDDILSRPIESLGLEDEPLA
jgi:membrane-bound ClpP family serine protease